MVINKNSTTLHNYDTIALAEMDSVKLMDRTDVKYMFHSNLLANILEDLQPHYRVLEINNQRLCPYQTLYFDTPDLALYHAHRSNRLNRYKVRFRNYVGSDLSFFEVKFKNNKGRTIKKRIARAEQPDKYLNTENALFLSQKSELDPALLQAIMWVDYDRITLVSRHTPERVTIDLNLTFRNNTQQKNYENLVIAEVKQQKMSSSVLIDVLKKYQIREGSISKYCFGIVSLFPDVKQNNFKRHLRRVERVLTVGQATDMV